MKTNNLPREKETMFLLDQEIRVIKVFSEFQFAKVEYIQNHKQFFVDINLLTLFPVNERAISIKLLGGV